MRYILCALFVLALVVPVFAVGKIALPPVGELGDTRAVSCGEQVVELRYYDFDPPDADRWQAIGLGLSGEPDFFRAYFKSDDSDTSPVFVDADRDGLAEATMTWEQARAKYESWCGAYEQIRKGR